MELLAGHFNVEKDLGINVSSSSQTCLDAGGFSFVWTYFLSLCELAAIEVVVPS